MPIILVYGMVFASFTFHFNNISSNDLAPLSGKHMFFIKWSTGIYRIERAATNLQSTSIQFGSYQTNRCKIKTPRSKPQNQNSKNQNQSSNIQNQNSKNQNQSSKIQNQNSKIQNQSSKIHKLRKDIIIIHREMCADFLKERAKALFFNKIP